MRLLDECSDDDPNFGTRSVEFSEVGVNQMQKRPLKFETMGNKKGTTEGVSVDIITNGLKSCQIRENKSDGLTAMLTSLTIEEKKPDNKQCPAQEPQEVDELTESKTAEDSVKKTAQDSAKKAAEDAPKRAAEDEVKTAEIPEAKEEVKRSDMLVKLDAPSLDENEDTEENGPELIDGLGSRGPSYGVPVNHNPDNCYLPNSHNVPAFQMPHNFPNYSNGHQQNMYGGSTAGGQMKKRTLDKQEAIDPYYKFSCPQMSLDGMTSDDMVYLPYDHQAQEPTVNNLNDLSGRKKVTNVFRTQMSGGTMVETDEQPLQDCQPQKHGGDSFVDLNIPIPHEIVTELIDFNNQSGPGMFFEGHYLFRPGGQTLTDSTLHDDGASEGYNSDASPLQTSPTPSPGSVMEASNSSPPRPSWSPLSNCSLDSGVNSPLAEEQVYGSQRSPRQNIMGRHQTGGQSQMGPTVRASPHHNMMVSPLNAGSPPQHIMSSPQHIISSPQHTMSSPQHTMSSPPHVMSPDHLAMSPQQPMMSGWASLMSAPHQGAAAHQHMSGLQHFSAPQPVTAPQPMSAPRYTSTSHHLSSYTMSQPYQNFQAQKTSIPCSDSSDCIEHPFVSSHLEDLNNALQVASEDLKEQQARKVYQRILQGPTMESLPDIAELNLKPPGGQHVNTTPAPVSAPASTINRTISGNQVMQPTCNKPAAYPELRPPAVAPQRIPPNNAKATTSPQPAPPPGKIAIQKISKPQTSTAANLPMSSTANRTGIPVLIMTTPPVRPRFPPIAPKAPTNLAEVNAPVSSNIPQTVMSESVRPPPDRDAPKPGCSGPMEKTKKDKHLNLARRLVAEMSKPDLKYMDEDGDTYVHVAVCKADCFMVQALLERMVREGLIDMIDKQNKMRQTPIYLAVSTNNPEMVQLLIDHKADANPLAEFILPTGAREKSAAIHCASQRGEKYLETLKSLLRSPEINLNQVNSDGHTALHCAILAHGRVDADGQQLNSIPIIQALISAGADPNLQTQQSGKTALMYALESRDLELIEKTFQQVEPSRLATYLKTQAFDGSTCHRIAELMKQNLHPTDQHRLGSCLKVNTLSR